MNFIGTRLTTNTTVSISEVTCKPIIKIGGPISKTLDITNVNSFTKVVPGVVKRVDIGGGTQ